ncbi:MAG TPA: Gfo/Idh/MocA family oxidoreductase [Amycolatopsis sp.]|nr:Gfo/Idh/MocA family oxidoreductase [Amycolatopsis sp.]
MTVRPIKAALVGVGAMNRIVASLLREKGVEIVGAVGRSPSKAGRDLGEVLGLGSSLGIPVTTDAGSMYTSTRPDIALIATSSFMTDQYAVLTDCARHGVNAITIGEELLHPWYTAPEQTRELDALARRHGVTLAGGGFQDFFLVNQLAGLLGTMNRLDRLSGRQTFNVDDYGPEVARDQQVGVSVADFTRWRQSDERPPGFGLPILAAIAEASDLTVAGAEFDVRPELAEQVTPCRSLGITVDPGELIGFTTVDTVTTEEGPTLTMELSGHLYQPGETDQFAWSAYGDPEVRVVNPDVDTLRTTCTQMVNRIPDVINAAPGFIGPAGLPPLRYRPRPFAEYVFGPTPEQLRSAQN